MNKRSYVIVCTLLAIIVGAGIYVFVSPQQPLTTTTPTNTQPEAASSAKTSTAQPGVYTTYSEDSVKTTSGTKLIFFHAPWCPQCRELDNSIKGSSIPSDTTIFKVDYDSNQALRQKYGVTLQTTIVKIDDNGNKIDSYVAYEHPDFAHVKAELLP